jgi:hypothetical protein
VMRVGERGTAATVSLPVPNVRVAEDWVKIPLDVVLPVDQMGGHVLDRIRNGKDSDVFKGITRLDITGKGDRIQVDVVAAGSNRASARLEGTVRFDVERSAIEVKDLQWTAGSGDQLARKIPGIDVTGLRDRLERELAFDVKEELQSKRQLLPVAINRTLIEGLTMEGAILGFVPESPIIEGTRLVLRHWAFGPAWIKSADSASR